MAIETSHPLSRSQPLEIPSIITGDRPVPHSSPLYTFILISSLLSSSLIAVGCIEDRVGARLDADRTSQQSGGQREASEALDDSVGEEAEAALDVAIDGRPTPSLIDMNMDIDGSPDAISPPLGGHSDGVDMMTDEVDRLPDFAPPIEVTPPEAEDERCDGRDNDLDGRVDEEVSNACGGCTPLEGQSCVSWTAQMVQGMDALLDPTRIIGLAASVRDTERFELGDVECLRVISPQGPISALGRASLTSPLADLTLIEDESRPGRYRPILMEPPFTLHRPGDRVELSWTGEDSLTPDDPMSIPEGRLSLTSPARLNTSNQSSLQPILDLFTRNPNIDSDFPRLRWSAIPQDLEIPEGQEDVLTLYVGGSKSLFQQGDYRGIQHYQMNASLVDDGLFILPLTEADGLEGSSTWVFLERSRRAWLNFGLHSVTAKIGHRVELRQSGVSMGGDSPPPFELTSPDPLDPRVDPQEGLELSWTTPESGFEGALTVSLILSGVARTEQLICSVSEPELGGLLIPPEHLNFWPTTMGSLRQVSLKADLKSIELSAPDRGQYRSSVSLILRLSSP